MFTYPLTQKFSHFFAAIKTAHSWESTDTILKTNAHIIKSVEQLLFDHRILLRVSECSGRV
jgi:hypothetical protein